MTVYVPISDVEIEPEAPITQALMQRLRDNVLALSGGHLVGLELSNNVSDAANDIDIGAGVAVSDDAGDAIVLESQITKRLDAAWVQGTGQGGRDAGAIADGTWHVFAIKNPATGAADVLFSSSPTSPTMPSGFDLKRRIGSILRESSSIAPFVQRGDQFLRGVRAINLTDVAPSATAQLVTVSVPLGIEVTAILQLRASGSGANGVLISPPQVADAEPAIHSADMQGHSGSTKVLCLTNTSAQVRRREITGTFTLSLATIGWIDTRGRFS